MFSDWVLLFYIYDFYENGKIKFQLFFYKVYKEFPVLCYCIYRFSYMMLKNSTYISSFLLHLCKRLYFLQWKFDRKKITNNQHFLLKHQYRKSSFSRENKCIQPLHHKTCIQKCVSLFYVFREFKECEYIIWNFKFYFF